MERPGTRIRTFTCPLLKAKKRLIFANFDDFLTLFLKKCIGQDLTLYDTKK